MELGRDPRLHGILHALRRTPEPHTDFFTKMSLFGAGVLVGASVAMLLAPHFEEAIETDDDDDGDDAL